MPKTETPRKRVVHQKASGGSVTTGITGGGKKRLKKTGLKKAKEIKRAVVGDNATTTSTGGTLTHALNTPPKKRG
jgi:hypothetical protein